MSLGRKFRYYLILFLRLKGMPSKVALGFALGGCVNFYPTFGLGVPIAIFIAGICRANLAAGLLGDLTFKPLFPVMFTINLIVGNKLSGGGVLHLKPILRGLISMHWPTYQMVGKIFFLGAVINSLLLGTIIYIIVYKIFTSYRRQMIEIFLTRKII